MGAIVKSLTSGMEIQQIKAAFVKITVFFAENNESLLRKNFLCDIIVPVSKYDNLKRDPFERLPILTGELRE